MPAEKYGFADDFGGAIRARPMGHRGSGASPLAECELHEMAESLECALAKSPGQYMIVFRLLDLQYRSIADTAEQLQLSIAAVKSRHRRARIKIRCLLTKMHRIGQRSRLQMASGLGG